jgi:hypothetical protein
MRANEAKRFENISATTADFILMGGTYQIAVVGTGFGSVVMHQVCADGTTGVVTHTALVANGVATSIQIPPGAYRIVIVTATAVYVVVTRIPQD